MQIDIVVRWRRFVEPPQTAWDAPINAAAALTSCGTTVAAERHQVFDVAPFFGRKRIPGEHSMSAGTIRARGGSTSGTGGR
jgi:hypothetical protein